MSHHEHRGGDGGRAFVGVASGQRDRAGVAGRHGQCAGAPGPADHPTDGGGFVVRRGEIIGGGEGADLSGGAVEVNGADEVQFIVRRGGIEDERARVEGGTPPLHGLWAGGGTEGDIHRVEGIECHGDIGTEPTDPAGDLHLALASAAGAGHVELRFPDAAVEG